LKEKTEIRKEGKERKGKGKGGDLID